MFSRAPGLYWRGVYTLAWMHVDLSIMVFLGGIILAGIVVNNAIVLVDYINQLRRRGRPEAPQAIVEAEHGAPPADSS